jgi:predicted flap endonuclease-1-like 5' DNA nuclease
MNLWIALFLGFFLGWIVEWIIDFFYLRNKTRKLEAEIVTLRNQLSDLREDADGEVEVEPPADVSVALEEEWQPVEVEDTRLDEIAVMDDQTGEYIIATEDDGTSSEELDEIEKTDESDAEQLAEAAVIAALVSDRGQDPQEEVLTDEANVAPVWILEEESEEKVIVNELEQAGDVDQNVDEVLSLQNDTLDSSTLKREIEYIEGIGPSYGEKLRQSGITNGVVLLTNGGTPKGRAQIAEQTGIRNDLILSWVNHVDLFRIKGIGSEYADLLERSGVDTVVELSRRNPQNLFDKIAAVNAEKKLVRQIPTLKNVQDWVEQAKSLPRMVSY